LPVVAALHGLRLPRPSMANVMVEMFRFHGLVLEEMRIERGRLSPVYLFSTVLRWRDGGGGERVQELDLSPGDALGLAVLTGCRLLVSDELAKQWGVVLSEGQTAELYLINDLLRREGNRLAEGQGLRLGFGKTPMRDALVKEFRACLLGKAPPFPEEDMERRKRELLNFLLGE